MLDDATLGQVREYLTRLSHPLQITAWLDASPTAAEMRSLLDDLAKASSRIEVVEAPEASADRRRPAFAIHRPGEEPRVVFAGLPLGH